MAPRNDNVKIESASSPEYSGPQSHLAELFLDVCNGCTPRRIVITALTQDQFEIELLMRAPMLRGHIQKRLPAKLASVVSPEDVLQDVWKTALQRARVCPEIELMSMDAWLVQLANYRLADIIRRYNSLGRARDARATGRTSIIAVLNMTQGLDRSPSSVAAMNEQTSSVLKAIDALPDEQHQAMKKRFVDGLSVDIIASDMKRSEASVRGLLARGLRQVRHSFKSSALEPLGPRKPT